MSTYFTPPTCYRDCKGSRSVGIGKIYNNSNFKAIKALEEESLRKKEVYQAQRFRSRSDKSTRKMEAYSPPVGMPIQKHHSTSPTKTLFHAERVTVIECRTVSSSAQLLKFSTASQQKNKQTGTAAEEEALVNFNNNFQISKSKGPSATTDTSDPQKKLRKAFNDPYYRRYRSRLGSPPQRIIKNDCDDDMPKVARPTPTVQSRSMGIRQMKQMLAVQYNICRGCCTQVQAEEEEVQSALAGGVWHRKCRKCQNCGKLISRSSVCEAGEKIYCTICYSSRLGGGSSALYE